tara:strand:- start:357 stop:836 length:480 start_codon:yes stop_codon:yes gene_type:complete
MSFIAPIATAVAPAVPYISAVTQVAAARQAKTLGQFNQAVQNRNAQVAEQEGLLIAQQNEFDLAQFDKKFARLQGETKTQILNSGVELSGSGLRILRANAEQAEVEKDIMDYNSKINQAKKFEEANFARIQGNVSRQNAKAAEVGYYAQAGTSLLKAFG